MVEGFVCGLCNRPFSSKQALENHKEKKICAVRVSTEQEAEAEKRKSRLEIIVYLPMMNAKAKRIIDLKDNDQTVED